MFKSLAADFKKDAIVAVLKAVNRHIEFSKTLKESNNPNWWKVLEASLVAISTIRKPLLDSNIQQKLDFDFKFFINQLIITSLTDSSKNTD